MKKIIAVVCIISVLSIFLTACDKKCENCEKNTAKYKATFGPTGGAEYICQNCYDKMYSNDITDDLWQVEPLN